MRMGPSTWFKHQTHETLKGLTHIRVKGRTSVKYVLHYHA